MESNKRPLLETDNEPELKKSKIDPNEVEKTSPTMIKKRTLKVIPPKEPETDKSCLELINAANVKKVPKSTEVSPQKTSISPNRAQSESSFPINMKTNSNSLSNKPEQDTDSKIKEFEKSYEIRTMEKNIGRMVFECERDHILQLLLQAKNEKMIDSIIVNDARLLNKKHPNYDSYLGHVVYTGAQSRAAHSNRAVDLELFLCPIFTEKHHFATIQIRVPAEYLTYRGNIAVRKSALWGTDVYTDDSDVVASNYIIN